MKRVNCSRWHSRKQKSLNRDDWRWRRESYSISLLLSLWIVYIFILILLKGNNIACYVEGQVQMSLNDNFKSGNSCMYFEFVGFFRNTSITLLTCLSLTDPLSPPTWSQIVLGVQPGPWLLASYTLWSTAKTSKSWLSVR